MPDRLAQLYQPLELPYWKTCAHRHVDRLLIRNTIEGFQQITEDDVHHVPVCCGPLTPCRLLLNAALDTTGVRGPEETLSVGGLPQLELHAHHGKEDPGRSYASRCFCHEDDPIAEGGPFALGLNDHDEINQLVQRPWCHRVVHQPSDRSKGTEEPGPRIRRWLVEKRLVILQPSERWAQSARLLFGCPCCAQLPLFVNRNTARRLKANWLPNELVYLRTCGRVFL